MEPDKDKELRYRNTAAITEFSEFFFPTEAIEEAERMESTGIDRLGTAIDNLREAVNKKRKVRREETPLMKPEEIHSLVRQTLCEPVSLHQWFNLQQLRFEAARVDEQRSIQSIEHHLKQNYTTLSDIHAGRFEIGTILHARKADGRYIPGLFLGRYADVLVFRKFHSQQWLYTEELFLED